MEILKQIAFFISCITATMSTNNCLVAQEKDLIDKTEATESESQMRRELSSHRQEIASLQLEQLLRRAYGSNESIAISSAWHLYRRSKEGKESKNEVTANWFLGYLEGRLQFQVPSRWSNCILNGQFFEGSYFFEKPDATKFHLEMYWVDELKCWVSSNFKVTVKETNLRILTSEMEFLLPKSWKLHKEYKNSIACVQHDNKLFVVLYCKDFRFATRVGCFENANGMTSLIWQKPIWSSGVGNIRGGTYKNPRATWENQMLLKVSEENVGVFGLSSGALCCELFSQDNGKRLLTFDSTYEDN